MIAHRLQLAAAVLVLLVFALGADSSGCLGGGDDPGNASDACPTPGWSEYDCNMNILWSGQTTSGQGQDNCYTNITTPCQPTVLAAEALAPHVAEAQWEALLTPRPTWISATVVGCVRVVPGASQPQWEPLGLGPSCESMMATTTSTGTGGSATTGSSCGMDNDGCYTDADCCSGLFCDAVSTCAPPGPRSPNLFDGGQP